MTKIEEIIKILTMASAEFHTKEKAWPWPVLDSVEGENINKVPDIGEVYEIDRDSLLKYLPSHAQVNTKDYAIITTGKHKGNVVHKNGLVQYDFGNGIVFNSDVSELTITKNKDAFPIVKEKGIALDRAIEEDSQLNAGALDELFEEVNIPTITRKPTSMKSDININNANMFEYTKTDSGYEIVGLKDKESIYKKYNDIVLNIPESHRGLPVESIAEGAFEGSKITKVFLSGNLREIKPYAFASNNINVLDFNTGIKVIGNGAFTDNNLPKIKIPNQVQFIGSYAFSDNKLTEVILPRSIESIETYSFANNNITRVELPKSVITVGPSAFLYNKITHINFPKGLVSIGKSSFEGNNLTSLSIPKTVELIFEDAFIYNGIDNESGNLVADNYAGVWHLVDDNWTK